MFGILKTYVDYLKRHAMKMRKVSGFFCKKKKQKNKIKCDLTSLTPTVLSEYCRLFILLRSEMQKKKYNLKTKI